MISEDVKCYATMGGEDSEYRYLLTREWTPGGKGLLFIMLNPSTADATQDDPTIRRCMNFARRDGYAGIAVVNLFAYRATDPKELKHVIETEGIGRAIGGDNHYNISTLFTARRQMRSFFDVVCAWGANELGGALRQAVDELYRYHNLNREYPQCYGLSKSGWPRHPLYLPRNAQLSPYSYKA
jgi:hypothetical protein